MQEDINQRTEHLSQGINSDELTSPIHDAEEAVLQDEASTEQKASTAPKSQRVDSDEEVKKCLEVAKQWAWNSLELGARTGVLVTRGAYSGLCQGGVAMRSLLTPLWSRQSVVANNVATRLGVQQQEIHSTSASEAEEGEGFSSPRPASSPH